MLKTCIKIKHLPRYYIDDKKVQIECDNQFFIQSTLCLLIYDNEVLLRESTLLQNPGKV